MANSFRGTFGDYKMFEYLDAQFHNGFMEPHTKRKIFKFLAATASFFNSVSKIEDMKFREMVSRMIKEKQNHLAASYFLPIRYTNTMQNFVTAQHRKAIKKEMS